MEGTPSEVLDTIVLVCAVHDKKVKMTKWKSVWELASSESSGSVCHMLGFPFAGIIFLGLHNKDRIFLWRFCESVH